MVITWQYLIHPNCLIWLGKLHVIKYCWIVISKMHIVCRTSEYLPSSLCVLLIYDACVFDFLCILSICICTISLLYHEYEINILFHCPGTTIPPLSYSLWRRVYDRMPQTKNCHRHNTKIDIFHEMERHSPSRQTIKAQVKIPGEYPFW